MKVLAYFERKIEAEREGKTSLNFNNLLTSHYTTANATAQCKSLLPTTTTTTSKRLELTTNRETTRIAKDDVFSPANSNTKKIKIFRYCQTKANAGKFPPILSKIQKNIVYKIRNTNAKCPTNAQQNDILKRLKPSMPQTVHQLTQ